MNTHCCRFALSIMFLLLVSNVLVAQDDYGFYLQKARQRIAEGDCEGAQRNYNVYKDLAKKTDKSIERMIAECGDEKTNVSGSINGHEYVDLGLPSGTLWATCNVGASKPEDYGNYYAWGETRTKTTYNWDNYTYANGMADKLTKYCNKSYYGNGGFTDNLTTLQSSDDPATAKWGSGWRTPSKAQWEELLANTTNQWTTRNGVKGRLFTSERNGASLFLPAAGYRWDDGLSNAGSHCTYLSRSLSADYPYCAWGLGFNSDFCGMSDKHVRYFGYSVRPVREKECTTTTKTVTQTRVVISGDSDEVIRAANRILNDGK